jgi:hypothetical protein
VKSALSSPSLPPQPEVSNPGHATSFRFDLHFLFASFAAKKEQEIKPLFERLTTALTRASCGARATRMASGAARG